MRVRRHWVVDASVALKWYFRDEEFLPQADSLLEAYSTGLATLTAPSFIRYEMSNAFVVAHRRGRISTDQLLQQLQTFLSLDIAQPADGDEVLLSARELTSQFTVAFYDALYLVHNHETFYAMAALRQAQGERVRSVRGEPVEP